MYKNSQLLGSILLNFLFSVEKFLYVLHQAEYDSPCKVLVYDANRSETEGSARTGERHLVRDTCWGTNRMLACGQ